MKWKKANWCLFETKVMEVDEAIFLLFSWNKGRERAGASNTNLRSTIKNICCPIWFGWKLGGTCKTFLKITLLTVHIIPQDYFSIFFFFFFWKPNEWKMSHPFPPYFCLFPCSYLFPTTLPQVQPKRRAFFFVLAYFLFLMQLEKTTTTTKEIEREREREGNRGSFPNPNPTIYILIL